MKVVLSWEPPNHEQVGLPPGAILKHAGGMFHLFIIEGRTARNVLRYGPSPGSSPGSVPTQDERFSVKATDPSRPQRLRPYSAASIQRPPLLAAASAFTRAWRRRKAARAWP